MPHRKELFNRKIEEGPDALGWNLRKSDFSDW